MEIIIFCWSNMENRCLHVEKKLIEVNCNHIQIFRYFDEADSWTNVMQIIFLNVILFYSSFYRETFFSFFDRDTFFSFFWPWYFFSLFSDRDTGDREVVAAGKPPLFIHLHQGQLGRFRGVFHWNILWRWKKNLRGKPPKLTPESIHQIGHTTQTLFLEKQYWILGTCWHSTTPMCLY